MNWFTIIFALVIGAGSLLISIKMLRLYSRVRKWPKVQADLISKEIFLHPKYSTARTPYGVKADYVYKVNGVEYHGHKIHLAELAGGQANHTKSHAEKSLAKLQTPLSVFVNPSDPNQSVVYCEGMGIYVFVLVAGIICLLVGLVGLVNLLM